MMERSCIGKKAKETVTGFIGEITAYAVYKTGPRPVGRNGHRWSTS